MSKVVFLIDEETSVEVEIDRLQYGDQQQGHEMQGIQPRQTEDKECPAVDRSIGDGVAVFPEKDEAADAPENPDAVRFGIVEKVQQAVERQTIVSEVNGLVGDEAKVPIVKDQNGERRQEAQHLQPR